MSWPVCHTPPRVVIHQIWVEKPRSATRNRRSTSRRTPSRLSSHQASPTTVRGENGVDPGLIEIGGHRRR